MKNLWNKMMNMSISKKFVIIIYSAIFFMFITLSIVLIYLSANYSEEQLLASRLDTATQINSSISKIQKSVFNLTDYFCITPDVQNLLNGKMVIDNSQLPSTAIRLIVTNSNTNSLVFYNIKGEPINFLTTDTSSAPVNQNEIGQERPFHRLINGKTNFEWEFIDVSHKNYMLNEKTPKIVLWRVVKDTNSIKPLGVLAITIDSRRIVSDNSNEKISQGNLFILDSKGNEILKKTTFQLNAEDIKSVLEKSSNPKGTFLTTINNSIMQVSYDRLTNTDFITFIAFPYRTLKWSLQGTIFYVFFAIGLFVILLLPLLMFISSILTKPIKNLTCSMKKFSEGDFDTNVSFKYNDEIGTLGRVFNSMVQENKKLIEQTYLLQIKEREAELTALQAQINPHFLYNIIDTIHWSALKSGDKFIADIAFSMGQVFRLSLNRGNNTVTIENEKKLIEFYLNLQKMRYKERLESNLDFSENVLNLCIPKLIIQPLVENSIIHGTENMSTPLQIHVSVQTENNVLLINVLDNGSGIPDDVLPLLPDKLDYSERSSTSRFALKNISERLKLTYGENYSFIITSEPANGTQIVIKIPVDNLNLF